MSLDDLAKHTVKGELIHKIVDQFRLFESQIQFIGEPYAGTVAGGAVEITVDVTDAEAVRSLFSQVGTVKVEITGGSAAGKELRVLSPVDGVVAGDKQSAVLNLVEGRSTPLVAVTGTGTVDLGLVDVAGSGLDVSDTATVTFS